MSACPVHRWGCRGIGRDSVGSYPTFSRRSIVRNRWQPPRPVIPTRDSNGGSQIAVPKQWNKTLIVHAHGGPSLNAPEIAEAIEDMQRFDVLARNGYAVGQA